MSSVIQIRWLCGPVLIFVSIYIEKVNSMYTNALEQINSDCSKLGSHCGGHSFVSCTLFCVHKGYTSGSCDQSCCTCYDGADELNKNEELNKELPPREKYNSGVSVSHVNNIEDLQNICSTPECFKAARRLKENMDEEVDPCDNFYEFACGNFIKRTKIPNYKSRTTVFTMEEEKVEDQVRDLLKEAVSQTEPRAFGLAKQFYSSCMNTDHIENVGMDPLKIALRNLGMWPVAEDAVWHSDRFHWTDYTVRSRKIGFLADLFIKISIRKDPLNSFKRIITLAEPALEVNPDILLRGLRDANLNAYYKYQVDMAVLLGAHQLTAEKEMLDVLEFEQRLANIISTEGSSSRRHMQISEMQEPFPSVNWLDFIQRLFPTTVRIDAQDSIIVESPKYIEKLLNVLATTSYRTQSNYAGWRIVSSSTIFLNEASRRIYAKYSSVTRNNPLGHSRSNECVQIVTKKMENAIGSLYIRRHSNKEIKTTVAEMVNDVRKSFVESLNAATWMEDVTLGEAKEKAWAMHSHIGFPEEHLNDEKLDSLYEKVRFSNSYFNNILAITKSSNDYEFGKLQWPVNKTDWVSHGNNAVANAFYRSHENSIVLPAAILQGHFYGNRKPNYINYGSLGWIIGHEITHGFDINGHLYDKNGEYRNWWDRETKSAYESKTQCFVEQYEKFRVGDGHLQLNGVSSQGENVADNVGIKQAYRGYQSWVRRNGHENGLPGLNFTPNQLFWISAANNWCSKHRGESLRNLVNLGIHVPEEYRVIGAFTNSFEFASDFKCRKSSPMNPIKKCVLW